MGHETERDARTAERGYRQGRLHHVALLAVPRHDAGESGEPAGAEHGRLDLAGAEPHPGPRAPAPRVDP